MNFFKKEYSKLEEKYAVETRLRIQGLVVEYEAKLVVLKVK